MSDFKDFELEQYVLGELSPQRKAELDAALDQNEELQVRIAALKKSNQSFFSNTNQMEVMNRVLAQVVARNEERIQVKNKRQKYWGLAFALCLCFVFVPMHLISQNAAVLTERSKGGVWGVQVYKEINKTERLKLIQGDSVQKGDRLLMHLNGGDSNYLALFSIDGNGVKTKHYPDEKNKGVVLSENGIWLGFSYELDDAPKYEKFVLVAAKNPLSVDSLMALEKDWETEKNIQVLTLVKKGEGND